MQPVSNDMIKTAVYTVNPDNITYFLGNRFIVLFDGEVGSKYDKRILGTGIKHQMGETSVKMYDKVGVILRNECTSNDMSKFRKFMNVQQRDGSLVMKDATGIIKVHILGGEKSLSKTA